MDIKPPENKPRSVASQDIPKPVDILNASIELPPEGERHRAQSNKKWFIGGGFCVLIVAATVGSLLWYGHALTAPSSDTTKVRLVISEGDTANTIAKKLSKERLIRSAFAFNLYTQFSGTRGKLQAGGYVMSRNQDVGSIVDHISSGKTDEFNIMISPGLTLIGLRDQFEKYGFSNSEIDDAFNADYKHPLLASRPAGATLEGYIYPETYRMGADQTLETLFTRSFDEMYGVLKDNKYLDEFTKRNMTIHQAVTLASIVQKEVANPIDQKQVAQVFLKRLNDGIILGSDVTFMYAAQQAGVAPTVGLDSPYNTRKHAGLPPGPIANMNPSALDAVAFPASGDYVYFVAGDDGKTYFSRTEDEHDAAVAAHCTELCR